MKTWLFFLDVSRQHSFGVVFGRGWMSDGTPYNFAQLFPLLSIVSWIIYLVLWMVFATQSGSLWTTHNKFNIEHVALTIHLIACLKWWPFYSSRNCLLKPRTLMELSWWSPWFTLPPIASSLLIHLTYCFSVLEAAIQTISTFSFLSVLLQVSHFDFGILLSDALMCFLADFAMCGFIL